MEAKSTVKRKEKYSMDKFFTKTVCDRCGASLKNGRIMSMFNDDCLCLKCKEEERKRTDYQEAVQKDIEEYKMRNGFSWERR